MFVASHIAGRMRIRDEKVRTEPVASRVREALLAAPGVDGVEVNPRVGSVLVVYSAAVTGGGAILALLSDILGAEEETATSASTCVCPKISLTIPPRVKRQAVNIGMLASLALSLAAAIVHLKKLHVLAGILFVALFGDHIYERRRMLFA